MKFKITLTAVILLFVMCINGCSSRYSILNSKSDTVEQVILSNKKVDFFSRSRIDKVLKHMRGSDYYKGSKSVEEYNEKVLLIDYGIKHESVECDYINFWNDLTKREVIITNAVYMLLVIESLDKVKIRLENPIDEEFIISRNNVESVYGMALESYEINEESLSELIDVDKIENLWFLVNS